MAEWGSVGRKQGGLAEMCYWEASVGPGTAKALTDQALTHTEAVALWPCAEASLVGVFSAVLGQVVIGYLPNCISSIIGLTTTGAG